MGEEDVSHPFTCKECGAHRIEVTVEYQTATMAQESMWCSCSPGAVAATRRVRRVNTWRERYRLDLVEHRLSTRIGEPEKVESEQESTEIDVACEKCYETGAWSGEDDDLTEEPIEKPGSRQHWVRCRDCKREVPFAWSEKDTDGQGSGRIWPVECADYDPRTTWLDPRYSGDD
jgi:hypothetical protein